MWKKTLGGAVALALIAAAPASAGTTPIVAYGWDEANQSHKPTTCTVTVTKTDWSFSTYYNFEGRTNCDQAVDHASCIPTHRRRNLRK